MNQLKDGVGVLSAFISLVGFLCTAFSSSNAPDADSLDNSRHLLDLILIQNRAGNTSQDLTYGTARQITHMLLPFS